MSPRQEKDCLTYAELSAKIIAERIDTLEARLTEAVKLIEEAANGTVHTEMMLEFLAKTRKVMK